MYVDSRHFIIEVAAGLTEQREQLQSDAAIRKLRQRHGGDWEQGSTCSNRSLSVYSCFCVAAGMIDIGY